MCKANVGIDLGRRYQKGVMNLGGEIANVIIENAISEGNNQYLREFGEKENEEIENLLDVEIYEGRKFLGRKFLGAFAREYNAGDLVTSSKFDAKFTEGEELIKVLVTLASLAYKKKEISIDVNMGTGLPTEEYFTNVTDFSAYKNREFKIKFLHPKASNYECKIKINRIEVTPEGTATSINHFYTDDNNENNMFVNELNEGSIFFINFGSSTIDVCMIREENGRAIYDPRGMFGVSSGGDKALNTIRKNLIENYGLDLELPKLEYYLRQDHDIRFRDKIIPLKNLKVDVYKIILKSMRNMILEKVEENGIDLYTVKKVIVSGGMVAELTKDHFTNFFPGVETVISSDPLFDEARGYLKFLEQKVRADSIAQDEAFSEDDEIEVIN